MKIKDSIILILAVIVAIVVGVFAGIKIIENRNDGQNLNDNNHNIQDNIEDSNKTDNSNKDEKNPEKEEEKVESDNNQGTTKEDVGSQEIIDDIFNSAQENANKNTIINYAKEIETKYLMEKTQNGNVIWVDANGKIDFSKAPKYEHTNVVCIQGYVDSNSKVALSVCKVDNYDMLYNYKNGEVTSVAEEVTDGIINEAQENANKNTIINYAKEIETKYLMEKMQNENVIWVDANGKIDFTNVPELEFANIVCTGDSFIDAQWKVTLSNCKVDDYKTIYNYKNNKVTSNAD